MTAKPFDPERSWQPLEARIAEEECPKTRALLSLVRDHMRTEIRGELEGLLATLIAEPQYHFFGTGGADTAPKGGAAVEAFYQSMIETGGNHFEFDIRRIAADPTTVVTEGIMRQQVAGAALAAGGIEEVNGAPLDPDANYLSEMQILTVWPAGEGGRLVGEDIYFGSPPAMRKADG